jgi:AcrR family transcriptional regulator
MQHDQDTIIEAMLSNSNLSQVAQSLGVSRSTLYRRLQKPEFREALEQARREVFLVAIASLHGKLGQYIAKLEILADTAKSEAVRAQVLLALANLAQKHHEYDQELLLYSLEQDRKNATA